MLSSEKKEGDIKRASFDSFFFFIFRATIEMYLCYVFMRRRRREREKFGERARIKNTNRKHVNNQWNLLKTKRKYK